MSRPKYILRPCVDSASRSESEGDDFCIPICRTLKKAQLVKIRDRPSPPRNMVRHFTLALLTISIIHLYGNLFLFNLLIVYPNDLSITPIRFHSKFKFLIYYANSRK
ncbi:unnamed protein product [Bursaphelenchus xylophilus]|uniref:(pine wood nematode) hypothetical protein n=1 Tax=Bursaphelenchus xylophilus TaxID=6326 RepID=A0A7I8WW26_BURXY|nr:unnamed protein product [Bursaphelenchus xylophilus]CAG9098472.1 unnamed protein product [Bursaphelenchus xylophilus]